MDIAVSYYVFSDETVKPANTIIYDVPSRIAESLCSKLIGTDDVDFDELEAYLNYLEKLKGNSYITDSLQTPVIVTDTTGENTFSVSEYSRYLLTPFDDCDLSVPLSRETIAFLLKKIDCKIVFGDYYCSPNYVMRNQTITVDKNGNILNQLAYVIDYMCVYFADEKYKDNNLYIDSAAYIVNYLLGVHSYDVDLVAVESYRKDDACEIALASRKLADTILSQFSSEELCSA